MGKGRILDLSTRYNRCVRISSQLFRYVRIPPLDVLCYDQTLHSHGVVETGFSGTDTLLRNPAEAPCFDLQVGKVERVVLYLKLKF